MADISKEELEKEIEKILSTANLATTSAKNVRQQLEKTLGVDLNDKRQLINQLVMDYVNSKESEEEEEEEEEASSEEEKVKKKPAKRAPAKAAKKRKESSEEEEDDESNDSDSSEKKPSPKKKRAAKKDEDFDDKKKKPAKGKKTGGRGKGGGYTRAYKLAPALSELMGAEQMPRHEVVKRVWAIIKEKQLYDPNNKQFAICDDALYKVFQTKRFRIFGMMKYLKTHFLDD